MYSAANRELVPHYEDRHRHGGTMSMAFVEPAVNRMPGKRFVKKDQVRWTARGAHSLLQVPTEVLNEDW